MTDMTEQEKKQKGNAAGNALRKLAYGRVVSSKFFRKHLFTTGLVVLFSFGFIAVRFDCVTSMETIKNLKSQINNMRTQKQRERANYMTMTRESAMQTLVDSLDLDLAVPDKYPIEISYDYE